MDTACSSSLVGTHLAHRALLDGETTAAVSVGVNLMLAPDTSAHMAALGALSPTGRSKTFDAAADGYGRGEGCVAVVLRLARPSRSPGCHAILHGAALLPAPMRTSPGVGGAVGPSFATLCMDTKQVFSPASACPIQRHASSSWACL